MSDISTKLSMNGAQLFTESELLTCSVFNLKMFLFVITIIVCVSCLSSMLNSLFNPMYIDDNEPHTNCGCGREHFSNDDFFSYKDTINPGYSNYQSTPLTSPDDSLIFGQANRYIRAHDPSPEYILEIYANLYVLHGNPFGDKKTVIEDKETHQEYFVYLKHQAKRLPLEKLTKDADGIYKLKFRNKNAQDYVNFNEIEIVHKVGDKEKLLLNGKFSLM